MPIFLLLIAGAIDLGRLFYAYVAIVNASKEGALFGAANPQCGGPSECGDPRNVVFHVRTEAGGLRDAGGNELTPTVACLPSASLGSARTALVGCREGDTYRVGVTYDFRLITPILGSLLERRLMLHAQADATVLNQPYVPIPGMSVTKEVQDPDTGKWVRTPSVDKTTGVPSNLEFRVGEWVTYRISVRNTGATTLSGVWTDDDAKSAPKCFAGTLGVGQSAPPCEYRTKLTKAQKSLKNTVTVRADGLSPVVDVAIIDVLASPPILKVAKSVSVFRHGKESTWQSDLTAHHGSKVDPTVWYRLSVTNTGGSPATGLSVDDSAGKLTYGSDCPRPPSTLDPFELWVCYYADTINGTGSFSNTLTVDSRETGAQRDSASVRVQTCTGPDLVVPNLVEDKDGNVRSVAEARTTWKAAGFSLPLSPASGSDGRDVKSQEPTGPFECDAPTTAERVIH